MRAIYKTFKIMHDGVKRLKKFDKNYRIVSEIVKRIVCETVLKIPTNCPRKCP